MLEMLKQKSAFKVYSDSSQVSVSFSDLVYVLLQKTFRTKHPILVKQTYKDYEYLLIFYREELFNAEFNLGDIIPSIDYYHPVTFSKEYLNSSYTLLGYWEGELN